MVIQKLLHPGLEGRQGEKNPEYQECELVFTNTYRSYALPTHAMKPIHLFCPVYNCKSDNYVIWFLQSLETKQFRVL